jgi:N-acylneuraminate cytidylyltransferase
MLKLQKWNKINEIIVTSDDDDMLEIASNMGVSTHKRDEYYASSEATNSEFFENLSELDTINNYIMYSPVTSPLISFETYNEVIVMFRNNPSNIVTVSPVKHHLWLDGNPLNYSIDQSPNSQDLPDIYSINYGISIISKSDMYKFKNVVTRTPNFVVLDEIEGVDIDTELDFQVAEILYNKIND